MMKVLVSLLIFHFFFPIVEVVSTISIETELDDSFYWLNSTEPFSKIIPLSTFSSDDKNPVIIDIDYSQKTTWLSFEQVDIEILYSFRELDSRAVCYENGFAYVMDYDHGLMIYNVTDPSSPELIFSYDYGSCVKCDCAVQDDILYMGLSQVHVYEVSDKLNPVFITLVPCTFVNKIEISADGKWLSLFEHDEAMLYDITDIYDPDLVCSESVDQLEGGTMLIGESEEYFIALMAEFNGFFVYDFSDQEPVCSPLNTYTEVDTDPLFYANDIIFVEELGMCYVACGNKLRVYNCSDKLDPIFENQIWKQNYQVIYTDGYMYAFDQNQDLVVYDPFDDPLDPTEIGEGDILGTSCSDIYVDGDYAYLACGSYGLLVVDVSVKSDPQLVFMDSDSVWNAYDIAIDKGGEYLYVADYDGGLRVVDVRDASQPEVVERYDTGDDNQYLYCLLYDEDSDFLYLGWSSPYFVDILDVSDPTDVSLVGRTVGGLSSVPQSIFVRDGYLYVACWGLSVFDISVPSSPVFVAENKYNEYVWNAFDVYVTEDKIGYLAQWTKEVGFHVIDMSENFTHPEVLATRELDDEGNSIAFDEERNVAFVGQYYLGVKIFDCTNHSDPKFLSTFDTSRVYRLYLIGEFLYIADGSNDVLIYDVSNASEPLMMVDIYFSWNPDYAHGLAVHNNRVFVACENSGLQIFEFGDIEVSGTPPPDEVTCGYVDVDIRARDADGMAMETFQIQFDDTCSEHGVCVEEETFCDCDTNDLGNAYYGLQCEDWDCYGVNYLQIDSCSGQGVCESLDDCDCNTTHAGQECEFLVYYCFNISAFDLNNEELCGGHGYCRETDTCSCDVGYFSTSEVYEFGPCTSWYCGKYPMGDPAGCNYRGVCVESQSCDCEDGFLGSLCEDWKCGLNYMDEVGVVCSGKGECEEPDSCICDKNYSGDTCGTNLLLYSVMTPLLSTATLVLGIILLILFCMCCVCLYFAFILCCGFLIVLIGVVARQRFGMRKFRKLKNVDLILKEQQLEEDNSGSINIRIDRKLFEIPFDELEMVRILGEGGSDSIVFEYVWQGRKVAFKCFKTRNLCSDQDSFDEFEREVRVMGSLSHPNVVSFYGASLHPPRVGIVMEFCENGEIIQFFYRFFEREKRKYGLEEKIRMVEEISNSMKYLHSRNIIHRDLKCENVLVDGQERCKLVDFGLSRIVDRMSQNKTSRIGTNIYMSPEIVRGGKYDQKCDVFSFGIMVWVIFTENVHAYGRGDEVHQVEFRVSNDPNFRPSLSELENNLRNDYPEFFQGEEGDDRYLKWITELVTRSWKAKPEERYDFGEILDVFWGEEGKEGRDFRSRLGCVLNLNQPIISKETPVMGERDEEVEESIHRVSEEVALLRKENEKKKKLKEELSSRIQMLKNEV